MAQDSSMEGNKKNAPMFSGGTQGTHSGSEIDQLRAERDLLLDRQRSIMHLLGSTKPERILHDIRNVLNERVLLRTLTGIEDDPTEERLRAKD